MRLAGLCHLVSLALVASATLVFSIACEKASSREDSVKNPAERETHSIDPCKLITGDEFERIQGSPLQEGKKSSGVSGSIVFDQCYFAAADLAMSVTIAVAQPVVAKGGKNPRDIWMEKFGRGRFAGGESAKEGEHEESEEGRGEGHESSPRKISGIGDEAFWSGTSVGGAFYVLEGNLFLRISVGGAESQNAKIEKSKRFAQLAIPRLSGR